MLLPDPAAAYTACESLLVVCDNATASSSAVDEVMMGQEADLPEVGRNIRLH
ncbi:unnamed protein product [Protopolystoma xenopodis]|uniref:Uncharacterized protein n=1 Tax=Protopolystoma xenopodis TaxID=117903 RepID=A0A448XHL2_9PLAT|nr:unnamed protein product [Protopolystoma xenopodis]